MPSPPKVAETCVVARQLGFECPENDKMQGFHQTGASTKCQNLIGINGASHDMSKAKEDYVAGREFPPFPGGTFEHVSKLLAELYSGTELTRVMAEVPLKDEPGEGITKWRRLFQALSNNQARSEIRKRYDHPYYHCDASGTNS